MKKAISLYGSNGPVWTAVSKFVGTRNSTQCRERYRNVLAGQHLIRPWTENETKKLMEYCNEKLKDGERERERKREGEGEREREREGGREGERERERGREGGRETEREGRERTTYY